MPTLGFFQNLASLLARLVFGQAFLWTGIGKLQNLEGTTAFFEGLGIPLPGANAVFVGVVEAVGGAMLILGLFTRPVAVLLTGVMVVAIVTAHDEEFLSSLAFRGDPGLANVTPVYFLLTLIALFAYGAGAWSVDRMLDRRRRTTS